MNKISWKHSGHLKWLAPAAALLLLPATAVFADSYDGSEYVYNPATGLYDTVYGSSFYFDESGYPVYVSSADDPADQSEWVGEQDSDLYTWDAQAAADETWQTELSESGYEQTYSANSLAASGPDYWGSSIWTSEYNPFNDPDLVGQCTWFAYGRFVELYGMDPGFRGDGWQDAWETVSSHPDSFYLSSTPASGAVFSSDYAHNHTGIVLSVDESGQNLVIQDGNLDDVSNDFSSAMTDYRTISISLAELQELYGDVVFANPYVSPLE